MVIIDILCVKQLLVAIFLFKVKISLRQITLRVNVPTAFNEYFNIMRNYLLQRL